MFPIDHKGSPDKHSSSANYNTSHWHGISMTLPVPFSDRHPDNNSLESPDLTRGSYP